MSNAKFFDENDKTKGRSNDRASSRSRSYAQYETQSFHEDAKVGAEKKPEGAFNADIRSRSIPTSPVAYLQSSKPIEKLIKMESKNAPLSDNSRSRFWSTSVDVDKNIVSGQKNYVNTTRPISMPIPDQRTKYTNPNRSPPPLVPTILERVAAQKLSALEPDDLRSKYSFHETGSLYSPGNLMPTHTDLSMTDKMKNKSMDSGRRSIDSTIDQTLGDRMTDKRMRYSQKFDYSMGDKIEDKRMGFSPINDARSPTQQSMKDKMKDEKTVFSPKIGMRSPNEQSMMDKFKDKKMVYSPNIGMRSPNEQSMMDKIKDKKMVYSPNIGMRSPNEQSMMDKIKDKKMVYSPNIGMRSPNEQSMADKIKDKKMIFSPKIGMRSPNEQSITDKIKDKKMILSPKIGMRSPNEQSLTGKIMDKKMVQSPKMNMKSPPGASLTDRIKDKRLLSPKNKPGSPSYQLASDRMNDKRMTFSPNVASRSPTEQSMGGRINDNTTDLSPSRDMRFRTNQTWRDKINEGRMEFPPRNDMWSPSSQSLGEKTKDMRIVFSPKIGIPSINSQAIREKKKDKTMEFSPKMGIRSPTDRPIGNKIKDKKTGNFPSDGFSSPPDPFALNMMKDKRMSSQIRIDKQAAGNIFSSDRTNNGTYQFRHTAKSISGEVSRNRPGNQLKPKQTSSPTHVDRSKQFSSPTRKGLSYATGSPTTAHNSFKSQREVGGSNFKYCPPSPTRIIKDQGSPTGATLKAKEGLQTQARGRVLTSPSNTFRANQTISEMPSSLKHKFSPEQKYSFHNGFDTIQTSKHHSPETQSTKHKIMAKPPLQRDTNMSEHSAVRKDKPNARIISQQEKYILPQHATGQIGDMKTNLKQKTNKEDADMNMKSSGKMAPTSKAASVPCKGEISPQPALPDGPAVGTLNDKADSEGIKTDNKTTEGELMVESAKVETQNRPVKFDRVDVQESFDNSQHERAKSEIISLKRAQSEPRTKVSSSSIVNVTDPHNRKSGVASWKATQNNYQEHKASPDTTTKQLPPSVVFENQCGSAKSSVPHKKKSDETKDYDTIKYKGADGNDRSNKSQINGASSNLEKKEITEKQMSEDAPGETQAKIIGSHSAKNETSPPNPKDINSTRQTSELQEQINSLSKKGVDETANEKVQKICTPHLGENIETAMAAIIPLAVQGFVSENRPEADTDKSQIKLKTTPSQEPQKLPLEESGKNEIPPAGTKIRLDSSGREWHNPSPNESPMTSEDVAAPKPSEIQSTNSLTIKQGLMDIKKGFNSFLNSMIIKPEKAFAISPSETVPVLDSPDHPQPPKPDSHKNVHVTKEVTKISKVKETSVSDKPVNDNDKSGLSKTVHDRVRSCDGRPHIPKNVKSQLPQDCDKSQNGIEVEEFNSKKAVCQWPTMGSYRKKLPVDTRKSPPPLSIRVVGRDGESKRSKPNINVRPSMSKSATSICGDCVPLRAESPIGKKSKSSTSLSKGSCRLEDDCEEGTRQNTCPRRRRSPSQCPFVRGLKKRHQEVLDTSTGIFGSITKAFGGQLSNLAFHSNKTNYRYPAWSGFYHLDHSIISWIGHGIFPGDDDDSMSSSVSSVSDDHARQNRHGPSQPSETEDTSRDHPSAASYEEGSGLHVSKQARNALKSHKEGSIPPSASGEWKTPSLHAGREDDTLVKSLTRSKDDDTFNTSSQCFDEDSHHKNKKSSAMKQKLEESANVFATPSPSEDKTKSITKDSPSAKNMLGSSRRESSKFASSVSLQNLESVEVKEQDDANVSVVIEDSPHRQSQRNSDLSNAPELLDNGVARRSQNCCQDSYETKGGDSQRVTITISSPKKGSEINTTLVINPKDKDMVSESSRRLTFQDDSCDTGHRMINDVPSMHQGHCRSVDIKSHRRPHSKSTGWQTSRPLGNFRCTYNDPISNGSSTTPRVSSGSTRTDHYRDCIRQYRGITQSVQNKTRDRRRTTGVHDIVSNALGEACESYLDRDSNIKMDICREFGRSSSNFSPNVFMAKHRWDDRQVCDNLHAFNFKTATSSSDENISNMCASKRYEESSTLYHTEEMYSSSDSTDAEKRPAPSYHVNSAEVRIPIGGPENSPGSQIRICMKSPNKDGQSRYRAHENSIRHKLSSEDGRALKDEENTLGRSYCPSEEVEISSSRRDLEMSKMTSIYNTTDSLDDSKSKTETTIRARVESENNQANSSQERAFGGYDKQKSNIVYDRLISDCDKVKESLNSKYYSSDNLLNSIRKGKKERTSKEWRSDDDCLQGFDNFQNKRDRSNDVIESYDTVSSMSDGEPTDGDTKAPGPVRRSESDCFMFIDESNELNAPRRKKLKGRIVIRRTKPTDYGCHEPSQNVDLKNLNVRVVCNSDGKKKYEMDKTALETRGLENSPRMERHPPRSKHRVLPLRNTLPAGEKVSQMKYSRDNSETGYGARYRRSKSRQITMSPKKRFVLQRSLSMNPYSVCTDQPCQKGQNQFLRSRSNSAKRNIKDMTSNESIDVFDHIITPEQPIPVRKHFQDDSPLPGYIDDLEVGKMRVKDARSVFPEVFMESSFSAFETPDDSFSCFDSLRPSSEASTIVESGKRGVSFKNDSIIDRFSNDEDSASSLIPMDKLQIWTGNKNASSSNGCGNCHPIDHASLNQEQAYKLGIKDALDFVMENALSSSPSNESVVSPGETVDQLTAETKDEIPKLAFKLKPTVKIVKPRSSSGKDDPPSRTLQTINTRSSDPYASLNKQEKHQSCQTFRTVPIEKRKQGLVTLEMLVQAIAFNNQFSSRLESFRGSGDSQHCSKGREKRYLKDPLFVIDKSQKSENSDLTDYEKANSYNPPEEPNASVLHNKWETCTCELMDKAPCRSQQNIHDRKDTSAVNHNNPMIEYATKSVSPFGSATEIGVQVDLLNPTENLQEKDNNLYSYEAEPDACLSVVNSGSVTDTLNENTSSSIDGNNSPDETFFGLRFDQTQPIDEDLKRSPPCLPLTQEIPGCDENLVNRQLRNDDDRLPINLDDILKCNENETRPSSFTDGTSVNDILTTGQNESSVGRVKLNDESIVFTDTKPCSSSSAENGIQDKIDNESPFDWAKSKSAKLNVTEVSTTKHVSFNVNDYLGSRVTGEFTDKSNPLYQDKQNVKHSKYDVVGNKTALDFPSNRFDPYLRSIFGNDGLNTSRFGVDFLQPRWSLAEETGRAVASKQNTTGQYSFSVQDKSEASNNTPALEDKMILCDHKSDFPFGTFVNSEQSFFRWMTSKLRAEMRQFGTKFVLPLFMTSRPKENKSAFRGSSVDFTYFPLPVDAVTMRTPTIRFATAVIKSSPSSLSEEQTSDGFDLEEGRKNDDGHANESVSLPVRRMPRRGSRRRIKRRRCPANERVRVASCIREDDLHRDVLGHVLLRCRPTMTHSSMSNRFYSRSDRTPSKTKGIKRCPDRQRTGKMSTPSTKMVQIKESSVAEESQCNDKKLEDSFHSCGLSRLGRELNKIPSRHVSVLEDLPESVKCELLRPTFIIGDNGDDRDLILENFSRELGNASTPGVYHGDELGNYPMGSGFRGLRYFDELEPITEKSRLSTISEESCVQECESDLLAPQIKARKLIRESYEGSSTDGYEVRGKWNQKENQRVTSSYSDTSVILTDDVPCPTHSDLNNFRKHGDWSASIREMSTSVDRPSFLASSERRETPHYVTHASSQSKCAGDLGRLNTSLWEGNNNSIFLSHHFSLNLSDREYIKPWGHYTSSGNFTQPTDSPHYEYKSVQRSQNNSCLMSLGAEPDTASAHLCRVYQPHTFSSIYTPGMFSDIDPIYKSDYFKNYLSTSPKRFQWKMNYDWGTRYTGANWSSTVGPSSFQPTSWIPTKSLPLRHGSFWDRNFNNNTPPHDKNREFSCSSSVNEDLNHDTLFEMIPEFTPLEFHQPLGVFPCKDDVDYETTNDHYYCSPSNRHLKEIVSYSALTSYMACQQIADFAHQNMNSSGNIFDRSSSSETDTFTIPVQTQTSKEDKGIDIFPPVEEDNTPYIQHLSFVDGVERCKIGSWVEDMCNHRLYSHVNDSISEAKNNLTRFASKSNNSHPDHSEVNKSSCRKNSVHPDEYAHIGFKENLGAFVCSSNNRSDQQEQTRERHQIFVPFMRNRYHNMYPCFSTGKSRDRSDMFPSSQMTVTNWYVDGSLGDFNEASRQLPSAPEDSVKSTLGVCDWSGGECACDFNRRLRGSEGLESDYGSEDESDVASLEEDEESNEDGVESDDELYSDYNYDDFDDENYAGHENNCAGEGLMKGNAVMARTKNEETKNGLNTTQNKSNGRKQEKSATKRMPTLKQGKGHERNMAFTSSEKNKGGNQRKEMRSEAHGRKSLRQSITMEEVRVQHVAKERVRFACDENGDWAEIGRGSYGCVYLGLLDGVVEVAIKDFYESNSYDQVIHEARMLAFLQNTGITPKFYGLRKRFDATKHPGEFCIIMEYFGEGKTLFNVLSEKIELAYDEWLDVLSQLVSGLRLIHHRNVLLNDLKADNILIDLCSGRKSIRYIDVGMATYKHGLTFQLPQEQMGKYNFLAPEVREGAYTSRKSDIYSLGYMLDQMTKLAGPALQGLQEVIQPCMETNPKRRPNVDQIVSYVHKFIAIKSMKKEKTIRSTVPLSSSV